MNNIDRKIFKTHQLPELFKQKWFETELQQWKSNAPQPSLFDEVTVEVALEDNLTALVEKGEYFTAAKLLQSDDVYNDDDEKIMPLHWAVMNDSIELVMAQLALGEDINQQDYECELHVLPLAMMYCSEEMFNFLLLHPDISVHHEGQFIKDDADIRQFLGNYDVHDHVYPVLRLMKPEYHVCHQYLNIDWNVDYKPDYLPLMAYAFENYDFETMNMLVAKGADINPFVGEDSDVGPNLINWALARYRDTPNDKNKQGIQWFAKFTKLLASGSYEFSSLAEEITEWDTDDVQCELGINFYSDCRKEFEDLEKEFEKYEKQLKKEYSVSQSSNDCYRAPEHIEVSILNDLIRENRVISCDSIRDVKFSRISNKLWIAVYFNDEPYPISISLHEGLIHRYSRASVDIDLFSATEFHSIFWFLKADAMILYCIEALANQHNRKIFFKVDDKPVVSGMDNYYINSLIKNADLFIDDKISRDFLSILDRVFFAERQLLDFGVLKEYDVPEDVALLSDYFNSIPDKASIKITACDDASGEQHNDSCLYIKKDMIWEQLFRGPVEKVIEFLVHYLPESHLFHRCPECGELGLISEMAYGEVHNECM